MNQETLERAKELEKDIQQMEFALSYYKRGKWSPWGMTKRRCPSCGNYLENSYDCDCCGWPYHVPSWGVNPGTGMFDKRSKED